MCHRNNEKQGILPKRPKYIAYLFGDCAGETPMLEKYWWARNTRIRRKACHQHIWTGPAGGQYTVKQLTRYKHQTIMFIWKTYTLINKIYGKGHMYQTNFVNRHSLSWLKPGAADCELHGPCDKNRHDNCLTTNKTSHIVVIASILVSVQGNIGASWL